MKEAPIYIDINNKLCEARGDLYTLFTLNSQKLIFIWQVQIDITNCNEYRCKKCQKNADASDNFQQFKLFVKVITSLQKNSNSVQLKYKQVQDSHCQSEREWRNKAYKKIEANAALGRQLNVQLVRKTKNLGNNKEQKTRNLDFIVGCFPVDNHCKY